MAGRKKHVEWGAVFGGATNTLVQLARIRSGEQDEFSVIEFVVATATGAVGGAVADILEPATSSWHRKFFHSISLGATLCAVACRSGTQKSTTGRIFQSSVAGHTSHLLLDALTPRGLPLI